MIYSLQHKLFKHTTTRTVSATTVPVATTVTSTSSRVGATENARFDLRTPDSGTQALAASAANAGWKVVTEKGDAPALNVALDGTSFVWVSRSQLY